MNGLQIAGNNIFWGKGSPLLWVVSLRSSIPEILKKLHLSFQSLSSPSALACNQRIHFLNLPQWISNKACNEAEKNEAAVFLVPSQTKTPMSSPAKDPLGSLPARKEKQNSLQQSAWICCRQAQTVTLQDSNPQLQLPKASALIQLLDVFCL